MSEPTEAQLTAGERLVRCLRGESIDRVPFGVGIGWGYWSSTLRRWREESGQPDLVPSRYFGYDQGFVTVPAEYGIFPHFPEVIVAEDTESITRRTANGVTKRDFKASDSMAEWLDYPVHTPEEWFALKAERLQPNAPGRVNVDWAAWTEWDRCGVAVQVGKFPYGVFGTVRDLVGVEQMLVWLYDYPEVIRDMMNTLTALWLSVYAEIARHVQIDHIHIWEDMSGKQGSLISPAMVDEFMMPCYDRIADFAAAHGVRVVSVDTDGRCDELVRIMSRHGINMFYPFEVQAGNDIRDFRRQYPALGILGGLDKNTLADDRRAIDPEIEKAAWMIENGGRYIPGFDHLIPSNVAWQQFCYAAECLWEVCQGKGS